MCAFRYTKSGSLRGVVCARSADAEKEVTSSDRQKNDRRLPNLASNSLRTFAIARESAGPLNNTAECSERVSQSRGRAPGFRLSSTRGPLGSGYPQAITGCQCAGTVTAAWFDWQISFEPFTGCTT